MDCGEWLATSAEPGRAGTLKDVIETLIKLAVPGRSPIHGWGLFACRDITADEVVDETPLLVVGTRSPSGLSGHVYLLDDGRKAIPLGDGILINESENPNVAADLDDDLEVVYLWALRDIEAGEELTMSYDGSAYDESVYGESMPGESTPGESAATSLDATHLCATDQD